MRFSKLLKMSAIMMVLLVGGDSAVVTPVDIRATTENAQASLVDVQEPQEIEIAEDL